MSDLISRQAAIDALCAVCGNDCDKSEFVYNAPQDEQVILCPEHYCLCTLPSAQSEPRWTPCSERLPEALEEVLVTSKHGYVYTSRIVHGEFEYGGEVIAWMPLPQPYEKSEDGGETT